MNTDPKAAFPSGDVLRALSDNRELAFRLSAETVGRPPAMPSKREPSLTQVDADFAVIFGDGR